MNKHVTEIPEGNEIFEATSDLFDKFGFSPAVRAGGLLYLSGQVGLRADGTPAETVAEQTECCFTRMAEILRIEGLTMADLVEVVSYHVDMPNTLAEFLPVKQRFTEQPFPAWSMVGVEALARPIFKIEIKAVAALRD